MLWERTEVQATTSISHLLCVSPPSVLYGWLCDPGCERNDTVWWGWCLAVGNALIRCMNKYVIGSSSQGECAVQKSNKPLSPVFTEKRCSDDLSGTFSNHKGIFFFRISCCSWEIITGRFQVRPNLMSLNLMKPDHLHSFTQHGHHTYWTMTNILHSY